MGTPEMKTKGARQIPRRAGNEPHSLPQEKRSKQISTLPSRPLAALHSRIPAAQEPGLLRPGSPNSGLHPTP